MHFGQCSTSFTVMCPLVDAIFPMREVTNITNCSDISDKVEDPLIYFAVNACSTTTSFDWSRLSHVQSLIIDDGNFVDMERFEVINKNKLDT